MRKITIVLLLTFLTSFNYAQTNTTASAEATANLVLPISLKAGAGDLDFGEIILTGLPVVEKIKPKSGKEFIVQGEVGRSVNIYFQKTVLYNYDWAVKFNGKFGRLKFFPRVVMENNKRLRSGDSIILKPKGQIGEAKFYVGGRIKIKANQAVGSYKGLFVVSVAY